MFFNEWQLAYQIGERIERSTTTPEVKMRYNMYRKVKLASRWMRYLSGWQQLSPWNSANLKLGRWPDASVCCACPSVWWLPCITDAASGPMNCWCLHYFSQWDWPLLPPLPWRWIANAVTPEQLPPCWEHSVLLPEVLFLRWSAWEISLYLPELHLWSAPSVPCFVHYGRWGKYRWK